MGKTVKPKLSERHIQEACSDLLAVDGWRRIRMDLSRLRGLGVQEKGMADDLYLRYLGPVREDVYTGNWDPTKVATNILWIEWKRPKGKLSAAQETWHRVECARGALTLIAGISFQPSIEGFREWYKNSGLQRKSLL